MSTNLGGIYKDIEGLSDSDLSKLKEFLDSALKNREQAHKIKTALCNDSIVRKFAESKAFVEYCTSQGIELHKDDISEVASSALLKYFESKFKQEVI